MLKSYQRLFFFFLFLMVPFLLSAQVSKKVKRPQRLQYWEAGLHEGPVVFLGDIKYYHFVPQQKEWRFATGISVERRLSAILGVRGSAWDGKMAGLQKKGNYKMQSGFYEVNLSSLVYFDNLFAYHRFDRRIQPYLVAGIGMLFYNTDLFTKNPDQLVRNSGNKTEGLLMVGLGIDFKINKQWFVSVESASRGIHSDYVDLKASGYPYDVYNITSVSIKYRFGIVDRSEIYYPSRVIKRKINRGF
jgi:hypothetical protein